jgi:hypothetical protein
MVVSALTRANRRLKSCSDSGWYSTAIRCANSKGSEAQRLLFEVFSRPLVYTSSGPVVSEEGAEILAQTCTCSLFPANAQYYTNVAADWPEITRLEGSSPSVRVTPSVLVSSQSPRRRLHASGSRKKTSASPRSLSEVSTNA